MQNHYLPHQYDISNIIYDTPECSDDYMRKTIKIYDNKKDKPLYIQTPELVNLFGIVKKKNYSEVLLPLGGVQCLVFKNFISNLENKILRDANVNKHNWFSLKQSSSTDSESKKKTVNSKSVKFIPLIKEINKEVTTTMDEIDNIEKCNDGLIKIKILDNTIIKKESKEITIDELTKNNKIRMILQIYAVWITIKPLDDDETCFTSTFGIYLKPEVIEEKTIYNLNFIEEGNNIIFESDDDDCEDSEESGSESE
jgi:hypothetical protein